MNQANKEDKKEDLFFMQLKKHTVAKQEILHFVSIIAKEVSHPSLLDETWVDKILDLADIVVCKHNNCIVGWLVFYANDYETKTAYFASLHILESWRQHHIASTLSEMAISICKTRKFRVITMYCNNPVAVSLFSKRGFIIQHKERVPKLNNEVYNFMTLYL